MSESLDLEDWERVDLVREVRRLREQCHGLAQAAMANGEDLLRHEREGERLRAALADTTRQAKDNASLLVAEIERLNAVLAQAEQERHEWRVRALRLGWSEDD